MDKFIRKINYFFDLIYRRYNKESKIIINKTFNIIRGDQIYIIIIDNIDPDIYSKIKNKTGILKTKIEKIYTWCYNQNGYLEIIMKKNVIIIQCHCICDDIIFDFNLD